MVNGAQEPISHPSKLKWLLLGLGCLIFASVAVSLYFWKIRYHPQRLAERSLIADPNDIDVSLSNELVSLSGTLIAEDVAEDPDFLLPGDYLALRRNVETYAWIEIADDIGEQKTYSYEKRWTDRPRDSRNFLIPQGHDNNLDNLMSSRLISSSHVSLSRYEVEMRGLDLPQLQSLELNRDILALSPNASLTDDQYIFITQSGGTYEQPNVGDQRITYEYLPNHFYGTVFGKLEGNTMVPYVGGNYSFFYLRSGEREEALRSLGAR